MDKIIIVICEGKTEAEFCKQVLQPYFSGNGTILKPQLISTGGGIRPWHYLKKLVEITLKQNPTAYVTTFIDFYGIHDKFAFPNWEASKRYLIKSDRLDNIEEGMCNDIDEKLSYRFKPYIQLHEFEGLLFHNVDAFKKYFSTDEVTSFEEIENIIAEFENPEDINDSPEKAPSKRLEKITIKRYNKPLYGNTIALEIGLPNIRAKCVRFNSWIEKLEAI